MRQFLGPIVRRRWYQLFAPFSLGLLLDSVARDGDLPRGGVVNCALEELMSLRALLSRTSIPAQPQLF